MTARVLNTKIREVKNKIPNTSNLVTKNALNTKISEVENIIPDNFKYIATQVFNKLTAENFTARIMQEDLVNKTDFDNILTSFKRRITSNKIKNLEAKKTRRMMDLK